MSEWLTVSTAFTDMSLVSNDTCGDEEEDEEDEEDEGDEEDEEDEEDEDEDFLVINLI